MKLFDRLRNIPAQGLAPVPMCTHEWEDCTRIQTSPMKADQILRAEYKEYLSCRRCSAEIVTQGWTQLDTEEGTVIRHNGAFPGAPYIDQLYWQ